MPIFWKMYFSLTPEPTRSGRIVSANFSNSKPVTSS